jgi:acetyl-CoA carboxylase biotin carboxyl carrier protein
VSRSRREDRSGKGRARPIVLPGSLAPSAAGINQPLLHPEQVAQIQSLIDLLKRNHLTELEIERAGLRVCLRHEPATKGMPAHAAEEIQRPAASVSPAPAQAALPQDNSGLVTITSPIVGTFYRSPSPDADPYVDEGDYVKRGQVLCIVEAMKLMNEIESEVDGQITKILVESTKPVEYGQPLFLIDPAATP